MSRALRGIGTLLWAAAIFGSTGYLQLSSSREPLRESRWYLAAVVALALLAASPPVAKWLQGRRKTKQDSARQRITEVLRGLLFQLADHHDSAHDLRKHLAVSVFVTRGLLRRRRLVLHSRYEVSATPRTGILWTPGKGVIGQAFRDGQFKGWERTEDWGVELPTAEEWERLDEGSSLGLTHDEALALGGYEAAVAMPLQNANDPPQPAGVISVTGTSEAFTLLTSNAGKNAIAAAARQAQDLLAAG